MFSFKVQKLMTIDDEEFINIKYFISHCDTFIFLWISNLSSRFPILSTTVPGLSSRSGEAWHWK